MSKRFQADGLSFRYPDNWEFEREDSDEGWTVSVQSPNTAFLVISCDLGLPECQDVADSVLEALRAEYPDLEAEECVETLAGQPAVGHNIQFISLDLTNTCWTRSFLSGAGTILVMCQSTDLELPENEPLLRAICASLEATDEIEPETL